MSSHWYELRDPSTVTTPGLLVFPDRIAENIRRMIETGGGVERLRPHVKTHKLAEVVAMHLQAGITRFKTATIAETEMCAACGAPDVLLAYQPVGPNVERLIQLVRTFSGTQFSAIADDEGAIRAMSGAFARSGVSVEVLLDIDCGMHRTGVQPGAEAGMLYRLLAQLPGLRPGGLHVYDGHIHTTDLAQRTRECDAAFASADTLRRDLLGEGLPVPRVVAGGTPTFPIHASRHDVECSPGTYVFWDFGYAEMLPDLPFEIAAVVLTRVVSKPAPNRLCVDLGHKAIASESPQPRVRFLNLPDAVPVMHSEEHLVLETPRARDFQVGECLYGVPKHICPTIALHLEAVVVRQGQAVDRWEIRARARRLTV